MVTNVIFAQNILVDGSFEAYKSCPSQITGLQHYFDNVSSPTSSSGDYYNTCGFADFNVPENLKGSQPAAEGNGYVGIYLFALNNYREYIQLNTSQTLKEGYPYKIQIKVSLAEDSNLAVRGLSMILGNRKIIQANSSALTYSKLDLIPGYEFYPVNLVADKSMGEQNEWITLSAEFVAKGFENHVMLGNFKNNVETQLMLWARKRNSSDFAYYYFDDVSLIELPITKYDNDKIYVLETKPYEPKGYKLDDKAIANVNKIFKYLKKNSDIQMKITGHSDDTGTPEYNQFVSSLRARAVALYLKKLGIDESRIVWEGLGSSRPLRNGKIKQNIDDRRVEFVMTQPEDH